ncbi:MAG: penicillin-binding protein activator LpoB [Burkholderiales bacterium]|nr:penicillin-binding protein activator LpoB [Burkholderiales bacterium]
MKTKLLQLSLLSATVFLGGCASPTISYVDPNAVNNLTTNFNQNDLRAVAQDMSMQLIQSGKMNKCKSYTISPVKNSTDQYVDTSVMTNAMADKLSNSSAVNSTYVVSTQEMQNQVDELERQNQSGLYDQSTTAKTGKMKGAQCRVDGKLTSDTSVGPDGKTTLVSYTFFVQVFDVQQGAAIWRNSKNISKAKTY